MSYISAIKGFGARVAVKAVKYAPHILVGVGIVSVTAGTVMAVKNASKAEHIIDEHEEEMAKIEEEKELAAQKKRIYTHKNEMEDKVRVYSRTMWKIVKENWKPIVLYVGGVGCILTGHRILNERYLALAASYAGLHKSYSDYRQRVADQIGVEADNEFANDVRGTVHYNFKDVDENGEEREEQKDAHEVIDPNNISMYSVLFDDMYSSMWTPNPIQNMDTIVGVERWWNQRFEYRKFVYYHEVLRDLGIWDRLEEEKQRQLVGLGWVWGCGDDHISLGIFDVNRPVSDAKKEFIMGYEPSILIDPNLDGMVAELL